MQKREVRKPGTNRPAALLATNESPGSTCCLADSKVVDGQCFLTGVQPWQSCPGQQVVPLSSNQDRRPLGGHTQTPGRDTVFFFGYGFQQVGFCFGVSCLLREEQMRTGAGDEEGT